MVKKIWQLSIIIPLIFLYMTLITYFSISVIEIGMYWSRSETMLFCISVIVIWFSCSPIRNSCCNGRFSELLFNLVPIEIISMLVFAQWHFVIAIMLISLIIILDILLLRWLSKEKKREKFSRKRNRLYRAAFIRCSVLITMIVTVIPCYLVIFEYKFSSPTYKAEQMLRDIVISEIQKDMETNTENTENSDPFSDNAELFACFEVNKWKGFNVSERITIMQELVDFEADRLGVPTCPVVTEKLSPGVLGQYDNIANVIQIDIEHLMKSSSYDCISTICHEAFHLAQYYLVENIDWDNEVFQSSYFEELRLWKANRENYKGVGTNGIDAYKDQPLEVSAREYSDKETSKILSYVD